MVRNKNCPKKTPSLECLLLDFCLEAARPEATPLAAGLPLPIVPARFCCASVEMGGDGNYLHNTGMEVCIPSAPCCAVWGSLLGKRSHENVIERKVEKTMLGKSSICSSCKWNGDAMPAKGEGVLNSLNISSSQAIVL